MIIPISRTMYVHVDRVSFSPQFVVIKYEHDRFYTHLWWTFQGFNFFTDVFRTMTHLKLTKKKIKMYLLEL